MAEKIVRGQKVCDGCIWESLHYCAKYQKDLVSVRFGDKRFQICCKNCKDNNSRELGVNLSEMQPKKSNKTGYFHVPGLANLDIYGSLKIMKKKYPEAFFDNREISEVYDAFPGAIWNGRTTNFGGESFSTQMLDTTRQEIENYGLSLNLTWNNHLVSGTDIHDRFCNTVTEIFHNGKHNITVASNELFEYLYKKYPNYKYYKSIITTEKDTIFSRKDTRFSMYLMNRKLNNNWEELLKIPMDQRSNIEFLCNDACTPICNRSKHYDYVNSRILDRVGEDMDIGYYCTIDHDFMMYNVDKWPITIKDTDIDKYIENGFCHFKICSRGDSMPMIAFKMAKYLAKPKYFADVFSWGINTIQNTEEEIFEMRKQQN